MKYKKFLLILLVLVPAITFAQITPYVPLEPLPGLGTGTYTFPQIAAAFFQIALLVGAALAVLLITFGGVQYMTSDVLNQKEAGRSRMKNAALGFLLLLAVYLILNTISPNLVKFNLDKIVPISTKGTSGTSGTTITVTPNPSPSESYPGMVPTGYVAGSNPPPIWTTLIRSSNGTPISRSYVDQASCQSNFPSFAAQVGDSGQVQSECAQQ